VIRGLPRQGRLSAFYQLAKGAASGPSQLKPPTAVAIAATTISRRRRRRSDACERIMRWPHLLTRRSRTGRSIALKLQCRTSFDPGHPSNEGQAASVGRDRLFGSGGSVRQPVPLPAAIESCCEQGRCDNEHSKGHAAIRHNDSSWGRKIDE
jgi:hypothetical protein